MTMPDYEPNDFLDDDEDGYTWDPDRGGDLGNYAEDEPDQLGWDD